MENTRVLLIDDEEDFVSTLTERLQLREIDATFATDGEQGLHLMASGSFHVVILDVMMPGLGGLEVLQRIKETKPQIPVILLTGHGDEKEAIIGMRLGALDYLMKPVDIEELIIKMQEAVTQTE